MLLYYIGTVVLGMSEPTFWKCTLRKLHAVFCGGATRAESVANGLAALSDVLAGDDWALVHDAARPCLSQDMLASLCDELADDPVGGLLAVPVADTLKRADAQQRVSATEPRDALWQAQTPQMFRYAVLRKALDEKSEADRPSFADRLTPDGAQPSRRHR